MTKSNAKNKGITFRKVTGPYQTAEWHPCHNGREVFKGYQLVIKKQTMLNMWGHGYVLSHYEIKIGGRWIHFDSLAKAKAEVIKNLHFIN